MDLEVVGRHALFFDDDSMATFANSSAALVDWNSLLIDRYDVRHLLSSLPPRQKRRRAMSEDHDLETELDKERYLDLPAESPSVPRDENDFNDVSASTSADGFRAVPFSYGNTSDFNNQMNGEMESGFRPPFPLPEILLQNIPPTEKLHQIIARTALFVSKQGAQSEIVLRVKQGGNPTFGFLMPDHHLHPYFRFLVEHQELLTQKSSDENKKNEGDSGALCLLGSAYGTGEDEDSKDESVTNSRTNNDPDEGDNAVKVADCSRPEESGKMLAERGDEASINSLLCKHNVSAVKRNPAVIPVNGVDTKTNEEGNIIERLSTSDEVKSSVMPLQPKFELPVVEPPVDMKRVINKIVDFIHKNGKELEATLAAQDVKYGMFPFLRPASLYHGYYRKVLKEADESKLPRCDITEEQEERQEKRTSDVKKGDKNTVGNDISHDSDKKEKFKMAVGKKKDVHDEQPRPIQPRGITVDANAVAAILQAARRGIRNPQLGILSGNRVNESSQSFGNNGSYTSSQPPVLVKNAGETSEQLVSGSAVADIAKSVAASEADSSEAGLSKEQKLKAERLKRAKMFMAMVKTGTQSTQAAPSRSLSVEPLAPEISESSANASKPTSREREGSSDLEAKTKQADDDNRERRSKRNYRPRSGIKKDDEGNDEDEISMEEDTEETRNEKKHSSKRSDSEYRHKHKRRQSSKDRHSRDRHKHDSSSDDEYRRRSCHRHKHSKSTDRHDHDLDDSSDNEHGHRHKSSKHDKLVDSEYKHRRQHRSSKHKHADSSDDEHYHRHRSSRHKQEDSSNDERSHRRKSSKRLKKENKTANEETVTKSDQSKATDDYKASSSPGVSTSNITSQNEPTQVSEELRAKIRAMLASTL